MKNKLQKNFSLLLAMLVVMASLIIQPFTASAAVDVSADTAVLVDSDSGKILYAKDPDEKLPPASMTKMMTEYLVWEAVDEGQISWDDTTQISDYPYSISADDNNFSGVGLKQNEDYTVEELYEAMAIGSDNGTTIALAELIAGSEGEFVEMMNDKAEEMGLPDYKFVNSTGLSNEDLGDDYPEGTEKDGDNLLSAKSAALLAYHLVNDYPDALDISSTPEVEFSEKFGNETMTNLNWMLKHDEEESSSLTQFYYDGVDGLKTGFTDVAGYTFTGTAEKEDKRLISVVMKTKSEKARFEQTAKLLDYGFDDFESKELFPEQYQLKDEESLPVTKGKEKQVDIAIDQAIKEQVKNGEEDKYELVYHIDEDKLNDNGELKAPVKEGEKIGTAEVDYDGDGDHGYIFGDDDREAIDLVTTDSVDKKNWFMLMLSSIGEFFSNLFSSITDTIKGWF